MLHIDIYVSVRRKEYYYKNGKLKICWTEWNYDFT